jgi:hypothetical protein
MPTDPTLGGFSTGRPGESNVSDVSRDLGAMGDQGVAGDVSASRVEGADTTRSADDFGAADRSYYRKHYSALSANPATTSYDEARTGYELGHRAAVNPTYTGRDFGEVELDLRRDFGGDREGTFERIRDYAAHAFDWKTILGGIALAAGGWWAGHKLYDTLQELNEDDEQDCRTFYDSHSVRSAGIPFENARTVYTVGYIAGRNPEYTGRSFDDIEPNLRSGFTGSRSGSYDSLRDFARRGYDRGTGRGGSTSGTGGGMDTGTGGASTF